MNLLRAVWERPAYLAAATLLVVCVPTHRDVAAPANVTVADLVACGFVLLVGFRAAGTAPLRPVGYLLLCAVAGAAILSTALAQYPSTAAVGLIRYLELFVIIPAAVVVGVRGEFDALVVGGAAMAAATFEGGVGVWQFLTRSGASFAGQPLRAVGTFGAQEVMAMATVVGLGIVVAVGLAVAWRGARRLASAGLAVLLVVPLVLSLSRGAVIATGAAVLAMVAVRSIRWAALSGAAVLAVAVGVSTLTGSAGGVAARYTSIVQAPDQSVSDRYSLWSAATDMWRDHPVLGVGPRGFPAFRDSYSGIGLSAGSDVEDARSGFQREPLLSPHNQYLLVLSEQGAVGATAFGALVTAAFLGSVDRARRGTDTMRYAATGVVTWVAVDFVYGEHSGSAAVYVAVLLGLAFSWMRS